MPRHQQEDAKQFKRIVEMITARSGGFVFTEPSAFRQWYRIEFGIYTRMPIMDTTLAGWLETDKDGRQTIVVNRAIPDFRKMHVMIHELSEALAIADMPSLFDEDGPPPGYDGDSTDRRHRIAVDVEAHFVAAWGIDNHSSHMNWRDKALIMQPANIIRYGLFTTPVETVDPFETEPDISDPI